MNDVLSVNKLITLTGHNGPVYALDSSGKTTFFSGSGDKVVAEWDLLNPGEGTLLARIPQIVYALYTDFNNNRLLVAQATGGIHVISLSQRNELRLLQYHESAIFHLGVSNKHKLLFSLAGDGKMGVISADSLSLLTILTLSDGKLRTSATNTDETLLAVGSADGFITVFSLPDLTVVKKWQAHQPGFSVNALAFSPEGTLLLSGSRDAHMNVFDVANYFHMIKSIPAHNYAIYAIAYNPLHNLLATASRDKTIKIWDPESFEVLQRINLEQHEGHKNSVNKIVWHHDTGYLISASDDRSIMIWDIQLTHP